MFGVLRFIRGFCGFLFVIQLAGLVPVLTWMQEPSGVTDLMLVQVCLKAIVAAVFGWLFFWLLNLINRLHSKKYGHPHPSLAESKWSL